MGGLRFPNGVTNEIADSGIGLTVKTPAAENAAFADPEGPVVQGSAVLVGPVESPPQAASDVASATTPAMEPDR